MFGANLLLLILCFDVHYLPLSWTLGAIFVVLIGTAISVHSRSWHYQGTAMTCHGNGSHWYFIGAHGLGELPWGFIALTPVFMVLTAVTMPRKVSWHCHGNSSCQCHGRSHGTEIAVQRHSHRHPMALPWRCYWNPWHAIAFHGLFRLALSFHGTAVGCHGTDCRVNATNVSMSIAKKPPVAVLLDFPWHCHGPATTVLWHSHRYPMSPPWHCQDIALATHDISWPFMDFDGLP